MISTATISSYAGNDVWDTEYVESLYAGRKLAPIEGVWQFPGNGATIAVTATSSTTYDIILIDSPKLSATPGTLIGTATMTAKKDTYDGTLSSKDFGKKGRFGNESVTFSIVSGGRMIIKPYSTGLTVSFRRWFYRIFGFSIVSNDSRPKDLDGALRIFPYIESDHYPLVL